MLGIIYQYQRVINAIQKLDSTLKISNPNSYQRNLKAIRKIRRRQLSPMSFFGAFGGILLFLLAFEAFPWTWEAVYIGVFGSEIVGNFVLEFFFKGQKRPMNEIESQDQQKREVGIQETS